MRRHFQALALLSVAVALAGCVAYHLARLPAGPNLKTSVAGLTLPAQHWIPLPGLKPHHIDPRVGFDPTDVAILAVLNDPSLQAARTRHGVAAAQLFAAGLLPDPVLSLSRSRQTGGANSIQPGSSLDLSEMLVPLITRSHRIRAAQAHVREVDLDLLWKGWQVAQRARWLTVEIGADRQLYKVETVAGKTLGKWRTALRRASAEGAASTAELAQLQTIVTGFVGDTGTTERELNDDEQNLRAMLGLSPDAKLSLHIGPSPEISASAITHALKNITQRRPDLLALAAGFKSSDQRLRAAVAAQFPLISVGFLHKSDTQGVTTFGLGLSLRLPFFNGNRGTIRTAEASRAALRASYQARLDQAVSEVTRLKRDYDLLAHESAQLRSRQPPSGRYAVRLSRLVSSGAVSRLEMLQLTVQLFQVKRQEIEVQLALHKTAIALETVLGVPPERLTRQQGESRS